MAAPVEAQTETKETEATPVDPTTVGKTEEKKADTKDEIPVVKGEAAPVPAPVPLVAVTVVQCTSTLIFPPP